ncbi:MAG: phosphate-starvation-inducible PsiE family protein [Sulfolobus sp.]
MKDKISSKNLEKIREIFREENIVKYVVWVVEAILIAAIGVVVAFTIYDIIILIPSGLIGEIFGLVGNALLIVVLLEIFQSIVDFGKGKGRSVAYVMDATMSFILREIILEIINGEGSLTDLLYLAGVVIMIAISRFLVFYRRVERRRK